MSAASRERARERVKKINARTPSWAKVQSNRRPSLGVSGLRFGRKNGHQILLDAATPKDRAIQLRVFLG